MNTKNVIRFKDVLSLTVLAVMLMLAMSSFTACVTVTVKPDLNRAVPTAGLPIVIPAALADGKQVNWCQSEEQKNSGSVTFYACDDADRATLIRVSTVCRALQTDTLLDYHNKTLASISGERGEPKLYSDIATPYVATDFSTAYGDIPVRGTFASLKHDNCAQDMLLVTRGDARGARQLFSRYMRAVAGTSKNSEIAGNE